MHTQHISVIIIIIDNLVLCDITTMTTSLAISILLTLNQGFVTKGSRDMVLVSSLTARYRENKYKMEYKSPIFLKVSTKKFINRGILTFLLFMQRCPKYIQECLCYTPRNLS